MSFFAGQLGQNRQAEQAAEKVNLFVILSEAKNLSSI